MDIKHQVAVLDAADLEAVLGFWAAVFGGSVGAEDNRDMVIDADGVPRVGAQLGPNLVPRHSPDGDERQQVRVGLWVTGLEPVCPKPKIDLTTIEAAVEHP